MSEPTILLDPTAEREPVARALSARPASLEAAVVGILDISKARGDVFLDAYPVTMEQLDLRLAQYRAANPALSIVIKGDAHVQYARVMDVMELLKRNEITDLGLATSRLAPK